MPATTIEGYSDGSFEVVLETHGDTRFEVVNETNERGITIVFAEDHPVVADGIVAVLAKAKDMVVVGRARDGAETIELLKQHTPDIALLDLRMSVVGGIDVARWIKRSGSGIRSVILTAFHSENEINQAIQAGARAYLLKDASPTEILKTIRCVHLGIPLISREREPRLKLKPLELEILTLIVQGHDNQTISSYVGLSRDTLRYHLKGLFSKLGVRRRTAAARQAIERGLFKID